MEVGVLTVVVAAAAVVVALVAGRLAEWAWWRPRRLGQALRAKGLHGTSYKPLDGDLRENARMLKEVRAKPMELSHNIGPRVLPFDHKFNKVYGKLWISWFGPVPEVTIMEPELVKEILSNKFGHFEKPRANPIGRLLATGLADYEGEKWAFHRRILNPAFHIEKLKQMTPAFSTCCDEMISKWRSSAGPEGTCDLDVWPELQNFTGDVISRTAFGSSFEEGKRIFRLQTEQAVLLIQLFQSVYIPGSRFLPTPSNNRIKQIAREVREILSGIIEKKEKAMMLGEGSKDDLLGLLLESNMKQKQESGDSNAKGMTVEDVIEECKLFYFAGHETTSVLLTWTMVVLSMHPDWQNRAREEVYDVFKNNKPDWDGLSRLRIVTMILYEVLRLYPPVVQLSRRTYKEIELGGIKYPPGVMLGLPLLLIQHDPGLWGEEALEFKPERFAEGVAKATKGQVSFFPFGWGPRVCIGQNFALIEAKMCLCRILQNFTFELSPTYVHAPYTVITLQPQHGAHIRIHKI